MLLRQVSQSARSHFWWKNGAKSAGACRGLSIRSDSAAMATTNKAPLSRKLWDDSRREALFALYNPFVTCLAAGRLSLNTFQHYIAQDAFFLTTFAKAYGMAMEHVRQADVKSEISKLREAVYEELELHSSLMKDWNFDMNQCLPDPATTAYVDFLLGVASGLNRNDEPSKTELAVSTLGAMTPCMRLYAFLGQQIKAAVLDGNQKRSDHPYRQWISTYSSPEFEAAATRIEQVLDKLSHHDNSEFAALKRLYQRAMMYEVEFFDAQSVDACLVPLLKNTALKDRKLILVSDFDSTCTLSDSCPVLAELAMADDPKSELRGRWNRLSDKYSRDYYQLLDTILQAGTGSYKYDEVRKALETVSEFEKQGNSEVVTSGVLRGIKLEDVKAAAYKMPLQAGCANVFQRLHLTGFTTCHILSVCWSKTFIEAALSKENLKSVAVHSNELSNDGSLADGSLIRHIETPIDKEQALLNEVISAREEEFVIYVGDSLTDLLCLLQADVGIVVGNSSSLDKAAAAFGIRILPLYSSVIQSPREVSWTKYEGTLYRATGWLEIEAFILGHKEAVK